jgi:hypothetical protein
VRRTASLYLCLQLALGVPIAQSAAQNIPRQLTQDEARKLVEVSLDPRTTKLPKFGIDASPEADKVWPDFYSFQALADYPNGSPVIDSFAVDRITGDVWSGVVCREFKGRRLRRAQEELRKKIGLTSNMYRRSKKPGPLCP